MAMENANPTIYRTAARSDRLDFLDEDPLEDYAVSPASSDTDAEEPIDSQEIFGVSRPMPVVSVLYLTRPGQI
jgi:hypothetical protein